MNLRDYQTAILNDKSPRVLAGMARRTGKDTTIIELLKQEHDDESIILFGNRNMLNAFVQRVMPIACEVSSVSEFRVKFIKDGPWIHLRAVVTRSRVSHLNGLKLGKIIVYEPAYFENEKYLVDLIDFFKAVPDSQLYYIGTPKHHENRYDAFNTLYLLRDYLGLSCHSVTAGDAAGHEHIEKLREELSAVQFNTDIMARFN